MEEEVEDNFTFNMPSTFTPPDNYEEGKPFDAVVSMVVNGGKMSLKSINGTQLAEESEDEESPDKTPTEGVEDELQEDGGTTLASQLGSLTE